MTDFNPPLWELIQWPVVRLLGSNELGSRLPSLLASIITLWLVIKLCREYKLNQIQTLAAVTLASLLPYQFWMAQDGRVYAVMTAMYLAGIWFALSGRWLGLAAICGLLLYSHITAGALVVSLLILAYNAHRADWKKIIMVGAGAVVSFLPWVPSMLHTTGMVFWSQPLEFNNFVQAWTLAMWGSTLPSLGAAVCLAAFMLLGISQTLTSILAAEPWQDPDGRRRALTLAIPGLVPLLILSVLSLTWKGVLFYRTISPLIIPLMVWQSATITPHRLTKTTWIIPTAWATLLLIGIVTWSPVDRGGDLREEAAQINRQFQPGDVVYHATGTSYLPFSLYLSPDVPEYVLNSEQDPGLLQTGLQNIFGINRSSIESTGHRIWIIWARDPIMTSEAVKQLTQITQGAALVGVIQGWQFSPIEIYVKE